MNTMQAVRIHTYGGPEVLKYEEARRPKPEAGEGPAKFWYESKASARVCNLIDRSDRSV